MKDWWNKLKKIPLALLLLLTAALWCVPAAAGRQSLYADYEADPARTPFFTPVFQGMHDGIYPWELWWGHREEPQDEQLAALLAQAQEATDAASSAEAALAAMEAEQKSKAQEEAASEAPPEEAPIVEIVAPEDMPVRPSEGEVITDPENETHLYATSMPEGVNHPVMQAVDYGVVDSRYLAPAGTAFNTDTAGPFAQNGEYYLFRAVNEDYFSDALIVGDSRTVGLRDYGGMRQHSTVLAKESLNIYNLFTKSLEYTTETGEVATTNLLDLLLTKQYRKVYLSVGINELGTPDARDFYQKYREALAVIRQLQPDAILYIQGIMHVSAELSSKDPVFNNTNIAFRNAAIATLANGHDIFYMDMNPLFCDADGNLLPELSADGIHLKASAYAKWTDFLMKNAIYRGPDDFLGTGPVQEGVKIPGVTVPEE